MRTFPFYLIACVLFFSCSTPEPKGTNEKVSDSNTKYVNTFIGTGGHGHTFPGAAMPYGMVQLSPDTRTTGWDACGGYHHTDSSIIGFSHMHLSGTGISDLGDILFMPFTGDAKLQPGTAENPDLGYRSRFQHNTEESAPGFYSVKLDDYNVQAELTVTPRTGFHRYTYPDTKKNGIILDLGHNIYPDGKTEEQEFRVISNTEIEGLKRTGGWAKDQHVFFYAKFDKPFVCTLYKDGKKLDSNDVKGEQNLVAVLHFDVKANEQVLAKVGISPVDKEGAKNNLATENPEWNFEAVKHTASQQWNKELSKVTVKGGTDDEKAIFYTSLYHTCLSPYLFSDADGRYRGMDQKIYKNQGENVYTVFSLWDTFRAYNPLKTILDPERETEFVNTLLKKYDEGGMLPMWELVGNYTGCMIGYHSIPVIVDSYRKGQRNFDVKKAYKAMVEAATYDTTGILFPNHIVQEQLMPKAKLYNQEMGFIPADLENESVSKALEFAYNDWCIAQMAKDLGKDEDYKRFMDRAKRYKLYFDNKTGYMRGKQQDGTWRKPFDPRFSRHRRDDYTEGNAFQWSWFVPHDVSGLIDLYGGKENFTEKLDTLFGTSSQLTGEEVSSDISGLIGQYAHGNEPSHHITHLYNYAGQHWKTQELTHQIMNTLYFNNPNGLAGNEDCGQMSAWYVLNAMGFYQVSPGEPTYSIGRPVFAEAKIALTNGKAFIVKANNNGTNNKYIQSISLNGKPLSTPFFTHQQLENGGELELEMGDKPNTKLFQ